MKRFMVYDSQESILRQFDQFFSKLKAFEGSGDIKGADKVIDFLRRLTSDIENDFAKNNKNWNESDGGLKAYQQSRRISEGLNRKIDHWIQKNYNSILDKSRKGR